MMRILLHIVFLLFASTVVNATNNKDVDEKYLSPTHMCVDTVKELVYVSLSTANKIAVVDAKVKQLEKYIELPFNPGGIAFWNENDIILIADKKPEGKFHFFSVKKDKIIQSINVGHSPEAIAITPDQKLAFVANRFSNNISVIDLTFQKLIKTISVEREPKDIAISEDGDYIAIANNIPLAKGDDEHISAKVTLIDRNTLEIVNNFKLANGSQSIEGVVFSEDGKYIYASHVLSRNHLPTTQLKHGWMNTNAVSVIDVEAKKYLTTVLLDNFDLGAANPSGIEISNDGQQLYVTLAGVHELCMIDLAGLHKKLADVQNNRFDKMIVQRFEDIPGDLRFLYGLKKRLKLNGKSPRHVVELESKVFVSSYFSSELDYFPNLNESEELETVSIGDQQEMNEVRRGEFLFADAKLSFQHWQSCITCHPDARTDGLNWDLLNDGSGNPKNNKSLLYAHVTPPAMITGIRESAELAVRSGIKYIHFAEQPEANAKAIDAYLKSLQPVPSPFLLEGKLSEKAEKGKLVFEKANCNSCHSGIYFTNQKMYDVGTGVEQYEGAKFDTPTLIEVWRTAPYLYDGRAKTLKEIFTKYNSENKHGETGFLTNIEIDNLVEYVLSI